MRLSLHPIAGSDPAILLIVCEACPNMQAAVVGAGPAGLTVAMLLARQGLHVNVSLAADQPARRVCCPTREFFV